MKTVRGLFWAKERRPLKLVPVDVGTSMPFTHQPTDRLYTEFPQLPLEPLYPLGPAEHASGFHFNKPHIFLISHHQ
jgi:hypothetical protein